MRIEENTLSPQQFRDLFQAVGWEAPDVKQIAAAMKNSIAVFAAYEDSQPVGMVRLLGDSAMSYYVKDFAIHPDFQGKGIGRQLIEYVQRYIRNGLEDGWAVSLELISSKGKEPFYQKFGFEERPCDWDGAGMFMMIVK